MATATGFVVVHKAIPFLVTNLHVLSGEHVQTGKNLTKSLPPDSVTIVHHVTETMRIGHGVWSLREERILDDSLSPQWFEHPKKDLREIWHSETWDELVVDIAVLPLTEVNMIELYPVELPDGNPDVLIKPGLPVHILGFPFGKAAGGYFPIWKTGHIASDFDATTNGRFFFIDASTRIGMSGAPVVFRPLGPYLSRSGQVLTGDGTKSIFMGIYSGRLHPESDIGIVWRPNILREVLDAAVLALAEGRRGPLKEGL